MRKVAFRPTARLITLLVAICTIVILFKQFSPDRIDDALYGFVLLCFCIALLDLNKAKKQKDIHLTRKIPNNLSFNHWHEASFYIKNESGTPLTIKLAEHMDDNIEIKGLNQSVTINSGGQAKVQYQLKALQRGLTKIDSTRLKYVFIQAFYYGKFTGSLRTKLK